MVRSAFLVLPSEVSFQRFSDTTGGGDKDKSSKLYAARLMPNVWMLMLLAGNLIEVLKRDNCGVGRQEGKTSKRLAKNSNQQRVLFSNKLRMSPQTMQLM